MAISEQFGDDEGAHPLAGAGEYGRLGTLTGGSKRPILIALTLAAGCEQGIAGG